jgi:YjbE family integral membrane protein
MMMEDPEFWLAVAQIIWIDALLSGDNAVVIALACRELPPRQRVWGVVLGALLAILLRVVFTGLVSTVMALPYLKIAGGIALFWIAIKLIAPTHENHDNSEIAPADSLWRAVRMIAIADAVMSLDNVIAVAAASKGHLGLLIFGLLVSIPFIMMGAALILRMLERLPLLVWAGAALLGWISGDIVATDPAVTERVNDETADRLWFGSTVMGTVGVVLTGLFLRRRRGTSGGKVEATSD